MSKPIKLENCPFCGQWLELAYECDTNDRNDFLEWYELAGHTEYGCIMDGVLDGLGPLSLPMALDFAEKWNMRANHGANVPERTCEVLSEEYDELLEYWETELSCGHMYYGMAEDVSYCPKCGARVVSE